MEAQEFINSQFQYAVVGATTNKEKYGYRVMKDLSNAKYSVVGVNPKHNFIDGVPVYATLADVPGKVDVAVFVVPPDVGLTLLPQVEEKGIQNVWFQPGAESEEILQAVRDAGLRMNPVGSCIMVVRREVEA